MDCKFKGCTLQIFPTYKQLSFEVDGHFFFQVYSTNYQLSCTSMATILSMFLSAKNTAVCFFTLSGAM